MCRRFEACVESWRGRFRKARIDWQYGCQCESAEASASYLHCAHTEPDGEEGLTSSLCSQAFGPKLVGFFRSSTTAKEKLAQVQHCLGMANLKVLQEVESRWNSTYLMLQRLVEQREPVGAALAGLHHDIPFLTAEEFHTVGWCLSLLPPFHDATVELSAEQNVSASKVVPLVKMLEQTLQEEMIKPAAAAALEMGDQLIRHLREKLYTLQSMSIMSLATLLDP
ncbi:E3 SUMO-protein ligase ZBED1-like [Spinachia spinachia]